MTDRELLEYAAKAAGIEIQDFDCRGNAQTDQQERWNPLTDDGDALRLAVKLGLLVQQRVSDEYDNLFVAVFLFDKDTTLEVVSVREVYTDDPYAATRRAIVRAAAEIGRSMK